MTISYKAPGMTHAEEINLAGFTAFADWLWSLGCGVDRARALPSWAETWREMEAGGLADYCIGVARGPALGTIQIKVIATKRPGEAPGQ